MKRALFAVGVILSLASPAHAWTKIVGDKAGSNGSSVTANNGGSNYDTSSADVCIVAGSEFGFGSFTNGTVTDAKTSTWTRLTQYTTAHETMQMWYASIGAGTLTRGTGETFTFTTGNGDTGVAIAFECWSGSLTSADPFDGANGNSNTDFGTGFTSLGTNSVSPTVSSGLAVTSINVRDITASELAISGYAITENRDNTGGNQIAMANKQKTDSSAESPSWTWTTLRAEAAAGIALFKPSGGSPPASGPAPCALRLLGVGCDEAQQ